MKFIFNTIRKIISLYYGIFVMPLVLFVAIFFPIMAISDAITIIRTGYTVTGEYIDLFLGMILLVYISLRFRCIRKIYMIFPSLFEALKYLIICEIFLSVGLDFLNWSYITSSKTKHILGIVVFILSIVIWRVVVSIYYKKKPISQIMNQSTKNIKDYTQETI